MKRAQPDSSKDLLGVEFRDERSPFDLSGGDKPVTWRPEPSGALLRAMQFLPELEKANKDLEERMKRGENVSLEGQQLGEEDPHITLNVGLVNQEAEEEGGHA